MVRDAIVLRSSSQAVKEKCLEKGDELTLDMAISIGQNYESAQDSMQAIKLNYYFFVKITFRPFV